MSTLTYFSHPYLKASDTRNDAEIGFEKNMTYHLSAVLYWPQLCVCRLKCVLIYKCKMYICSFWANACVFPISLCMSYMCVPAIWCCTYLFISCSYEVQSMHLTWDLKSRQLGELPLMKERKREGDGGWGRTIKKKNQKKTIDTAEKVDDRLQLWPSPFNPWWYIISLKWASSYFLQ